MKLRPFAFVAAALAVAPLAGCPIYDSSEIPVDPAYSCNDVDCGPNGGLITLAARLQGPLDPAALFFPHHGKIGAAGG